jgi:hypothetical protein
MLECLGVVWAVKHFRHYLQYRKFDLYTDHIALTYVLGKRSRTKQSQLERWALSLQEYDYDIHYCKGKYNRADPLSRITDQSAQPPVATPSPSAASILVELPFSDQSVNES